MDFAGLWSGREPFKDSPKVPTEEMHGSLCLGSDDGAPSYVLRSLGDRGDQDSVPSVKDLRTGWWGDGAVGEVVHKRVAAASGLVSVREGSLEVTFNQPERKSGRTGLLGREKRGVPSRNGRRSSEAGGQTGGQGVGPGPGGSALRAGPGVPSGALAGQLPFGLGCLREAPSGFTASGAEGSSEASSLG